MNGGSLNTLLRYVNTARYLKTGQIVSQLKRCVAASSPESLMSIAVPEYEGLNPPSMSPIPPKVAGMNRTDILNGVFSFQNKRLNIGSPPDWYFQNAPALWLYNLHYHDVLWLLDYPEAKAITSHWIQNYLPEKGKTGWDPYPVSIRIQNWAGLFFAKYQREIGEDIEFRNLLWKSICRQLHWLSRNLEYHLLANHLLENAIALSVCGHLFKGAPAQTWRRIGEAVLVRELTEQILPDGMHFERSPMYHLRMLHALMNLAIYLNGALKHNVLNVIGKMLRPAMEFTHPDGEIALLNDSAFNVYPESTVLRDAYANRFAEDKGELPDERERRCGVFMYPDTGYYGVNDSGGVYLIIDAAPIGPDYNPGHAHGDIFSFELSLNRSRFIVDSGVFDYDIGEMREFCRSTRAHNTVEIEQKDQCEFWGSFRVARRGYPRDVDADHTESSFSISGWHDGYERLRYRPRHFRSMTWDFTSQCLAIDDRIAAAKAVKAASRLHVTPDAGLLKETAREIIIHAPAGKIQISVSGDAQLSVEKSVFCPEFGKKEENMVVVIRGSGSNIFWQTLIRKLTS
ncbi:alginate lyase family protein [bacterium]|nr:alginate lyase family protein [candidate division CSSED10-310 bacterium]